MDLTIWKLTKSARTCNGMWHAALMQVNIIQNCRVILFNDAETETQKGI